MNVYKLQLKSSIVNIHDSLGKDFQALKIIACAPLSINDFFYLENQNWCHIRNQASSLIS